MLSGALPVIGDYLKCRGSDFDAVVCFWQCSGKVWMKYSGFFLLNVAKFKRYKAGVVKVNKDFLEALLKGESLPGQLIWQSGGQRHVVPGMILVEPSGQAVIQLILDEFSPVNQGLDARFKVRTDGKEVPPEYIPEFCTFESSGGVLTLVQTGFHRRNPHVLGCPEQVDILPRYVIAKRIDKSFWKAPVKVRAEVEGMSEWKRGTRSRCYLGVDRIPDSGKRNAKVVLETYEFPPREYTVDFGGQLVEVRFDNATNGVRDESSDTIGLEFSAVVEVGAVDGALSWHQGRRLIQGIQDLLSLMSWKDTSVTNLEARFQQDTRRDNQLWISSGHTPPPEPPAVTGWLRVFHPAFGVERAEVSKRTRREFIVPFEQFDQEMMEAWLVLWEKMKRSFNLFTRTIANPEMAPEIKALQLGAGLELLGYKLVERVSSKNAANKKNATELIGLVGATATEYFPKAFAGWESDANSAYQAMKHLKRKLPDTGEIARTNYLSILAIQMWLAAELGADEDVIRRFAGEKLERIPRYAKIEDPSEIESASGVT